MSQCKRAVILSWALEAVHRDKTPSTRNALRPATGKVDDGGHQKLRWPSGLVITSCGWGPHHLLTFQRPAEVLVAVSHDCPHLDDAGLNTGRQ